jgi:hypothetical protein
VRLPNDLPPAFERARIVAYPEVETSAEERIERSRAWVMEFATEGQTQKAERIPKSRDKAPDQGLNDVSDVSLSREILLDFIANESVHAS